MQEQEIEMRLGETLRVGDFLITVVDLDSDELSVRIDAAIELAEVREENGTIVMDR